MLPAKLFVFFSCFIAASLAQDDTPIDDTLPIPEILRVIEREFEAIVFHTPPFTDPDGKDQFPDRVESFLIEFGPAVQNFPFTIRQVRPAGQMQLLDDGVQNRGRVFFLAQNEDGTGMVKSQSSEVFFFISSSEDVNELRARMDNTFFDDFNGDAGDSDERRWNVAHSICGLDRTANFNINPQKHMHTQIGARLPAGCPSESITARARGVFDFTGREGEIVVDIDGGGFDGHIFFLEISKEARNIPFTTDARDMVRIRIDNSFLSVQQILSDGEEVEVIDEINLFERADDTYSIPNIRKPWSWKVSKDAMSLDILGVTVIDNAQFIEPLSFETASVSMTHENIQSAEGGHHAVTMHSDNFGFDGPLQAIQTLSYKNVEQKGFKRINAVWNIDIPQDDELDGAQEVRLMFTVHGVEDFNQIITVNGNEVSMEAPQVPPANVFDPVNQALVIPFEFLQTGPNPIQFPAIQRAFVGNVQFELDFGCDDNVNRIYTPPVSQCMFASNGFPISFNCDQTLLARPTITFDIAALDFAVVGDTIQADLAVDIETARQLRHNGGSNGIEAIEVLVDCEIVQTIDLGGAAFQILNFNVPLEIQSQQNQPIREVWVRALDRQGRSSTFELNANKDEIYRPFLVDSVNGGAAQEQVGGQGICQQNDVFVGGDCDDQCVFTEGLVEPPVCVDIDNDNQGDDVEPPTRPPLRRRQRRRRASPRSVLYTGMRTFSGYVGDWEQNNEDLATTKDPNAVKFDPAVDCFDKDGNQKPGCNTYKESDSPLGITESLYEPYAEEGKGKDWIDRDVVDAWTVDAPDTKVDEGLQAGADDNKNNGGNTGGGKINDKAEEDKVSAAPALQSSFGLIALAVLVIALVI